MHDVKKKVLETLIKKMQVMMRGPKADEEMDEETVSESIDDAKENAIEDEVIAAPVKKKPTITISLAAIKKGSIPKFDAKKIIKMK